MKPVVLAIVLAGVLGWAWPLRAEPVHYERPVSAAPQAKDIGGGYTTPGVQRPLPRAGWWGAVDVGLLAASLGLATWIVLWRRSRAWLVVLTVGCLLYFGFHREGCICPIGAIQNVAAAIVDRNCLVPVAAVIFFCLPLLFALLFGRMFCAGVCPLGALQELVVLRPLQVPRRLDRALGLVKYAYLVVAVWYAVRPAAQRDFIICRFDPFVGLFRFAGPGYMLIAGGLFLLAGTVIGRIYCRWLCPYGALLALCSRVSWKAVTITPDHELDCGLCTGSCPFGAIERMRAVRSSCLACARCYTACPRDRASGPVGGSGSAGPGGGAA